MKHPVVSAGMSPGELIAAAAANGPDMQLPSVVKKLVRKFRSAFISSKPSGALRGYFRKIMMRRRQESAHHPICSRDMRSAP
jgi:hypothetical protein